LSQKENAMRRAPTFSVRLAAAALALCAAGAAQAQAQAAPSLESLAWLAGCWAGGEGEREFDEQWMAPRGGVMLGTARSFAGTALADYEHLLIREEGGTLVFVAKPSRQPQGHFRAASLDADGVQFANPRNDFPQRVSYRRLADGSLLARIEGELRGKTRAVEFAMRRVACPG
jgi:hypothetical protein